MSASNPWRSLERIPQRLVVSPKTILVRHVNNLFGGNKMDTPTLNSGDTVVPLGTLATTVAILCGAINAGLISWELESPWWGVVVAVAIGGALGSLIGKAITRMLYSAPGDQVQLVKVGPASLPKTLVASLLGAIAATALLGFGVAAILGGLALVKSIALISAVSAVLIGVLWGILSALL